MRLTRLACLGALALVACARSETIAPDRTTALADGGDPTTPGPAPATPGADIHLAGSRLKPRVLKGSDGSQQFAGWRDTEIGLDCSFAMAADSKVRCLPESANVILGLFSDIACNDVIVATAKNCKIEPVSRVPVTSCGGPARIRVAQSGSKIADGAAVYTRDADGACVSLTPEQSQRWRYDLYKVSDDTPAGTFVEGTSGTL